MIMKSLHKDYRYKSIDVKQLNIVALIPIRGPIQYINNKPLLYYTVKRAIESKYIKKVIVSTDDERIKKIAIKLGAEAPFLRDSSFSNAHVNLAQVLKHSLDKIESLKILPDLVVSLETTFPFRPRTLIDDMIIQLAENGFDTVIAAKKENRAIWKEKEGRIIQLDEGLTPRQFKDPSFIELRGVGCVTHAEFLRKGSLFGNKIGIYELSNPYSNIEVRNEEDFKMASPLIEEWFR